MRRAFLLLFRLGALIPLALTELAALNVLAFLAKTPRGATFGAVWSMTVCVAVVVTLGTSLVYYFSRMWAQCFAGVVSIFWLLSGCQMFYDIHLHPTEWVLGVRIGYVALLIPIGAMGVACFAGQFLVEWLLPSRR